MASNRAAGRCLDLDKEIVRSLRGLAVRVRDVAPAHVAALRARHAARVVPEIESATLTDRPIRLTPAEAAVN